MLHGDIFLFLFVLLGAIYMHRAKQFLVHRLDLAGKKALSRPVRVGYYTACRCVLRAR